MSSNRDFEGRSVIVTGAGSGIGRAAALKFAERGAKVLVADLSEENAHRVVGEVRDTGGTAHAVVGDLGLQEIVDEVTATALREFGRIDVLVNNAGIMDRMSAAADTEDAEWERVLRINLTAPFMLARAVVPHMIEAGGGAVVATASEASFRGSAAGAAYTASKHGVAGLTKSLAVMYRDKGVRANAIAPGGTVTGISVDAQQGAHGPGVVGSYMVNMGSRTARAEEQAEAIVFLASDAASNINGVVLPVDNGWAAV
ncbi:SDR family NAD(P)-dependent oxidoreductase [Streptomyces sulphureus]|uniref:SDR family NAD(P)-dependent oxidoreductase n=1 Tax=Streptomyces sulphureus TaxID=47758 RepID=UPI000368CDDD|nr:SDR family NAD(P)-dependent oxidoreductase [Streptomyces sulphureus]